MIIEANCTTGEIVEREKTTEELKQSELDKAESEAKAAIEVQKAADKAALLEKLGITESEAALLLS